MADAGSTYDLPPELSGQTGYNPATNPTPFDSALSGYLATQQPALSALQLGSDAANRNIGYAVQGQQYDQGLLQSQYGMQITDAQTAAQQNAIALAAAQRQIPYISQLTGIDQAALQRQPQLLMTLLNSDLVKFGLQRQQASTQAMSARRNLDYTATGAGAYTSPGANATRGSIYDQWKQQLGLIDQNETQQRAMSQEQYAQVLDNLNKLDLTSTEQKAQAQDRIATLSAEAGKLGMNTAQLQSSLQAGLAKLGLNTSMTVDNLLDGVARNDLSALQIFNSAIQSAGQYASAYGGIQTPYLP